MIPPIGSLIKRQQFSLLFSGIKTTFLIAFLIISSRTYSGETYKIVVAADGSGDYTRIQAAIDACKAFPDKRITIFIKNGIYHEKVRVPAWNNKLSLIGESSEHTIISWDDYFDRINRDRNSTFFTYTLLVEGSDFYAENLTIENTAGPVGQAVALHVEGDRCTFRNCRLRGHQDTLYAAGRNTRQYYDSCYIEGTTDFIFGAATAVFRQCEIHSKSNSFITAASTPEGNPFGFVFLHCRLTASHGTDRVYLGRPWRDHARVAFLYCEMGSHILPAGWDNWSTPMREKTSFFAEYSNTGPGADTAKRVPWSHRLTEREAGTYTLPQIFACGLPVESSFAEWTRFQPDN
ncbi:MAG: pectin esterase [Bacteroidetes bacterium RBG_13_46_8]|nr:MAG: pectin esterase [Bacteroidetes bacterium RBG_13_46_8]